MSPQAVSKLFSQFQSLLAENKLLHFYVQFFQLKVSEIEFEKVKSTYKGLFTAATAPQKGTVEGKERSISK